MVLSLAGCGLWLRQFMSASMTARLPSHDTNRFRGGCARLTTYYISAIKPRGGGPTLECRPLARVSGRFLTEDGALDFLSQPPTA